MTRDKGVVSEYSDALWRWCREEECRGEVWGSVIFCDLLGGKKNSRWTQAEEDGDDQAERCLCVASCGFAS
jgi:hypothetical protein